MGDRKVADTRTRDDGKEYRVYPRYDHLGLASVIVGLKKR